MTEDSGVLNNLKHATRGNYIPLYLDAPINLLSGHEVPK